MLPQLCGSFKAQFIPLFLFLALVPSKLTSRANDNGAGAQWDSKRLRGKARKKEISGNDVYEVSFKWQVFDPIILIIPAGSLLSIDRSGLLYKVEIPLSTN